MATMPRKCAVEGCGERGTQLEGWKVATFDKLVIVWLCPFHHEQSLALFDGSSEAHDG